MPAHLLSVKRNENASDPFVLERTDESLDHSDAPVSAYGAMARLDCPSLAPSPESGTVELRAFVGDEMLRSTADCANCPSKECSNLQRGRLFPENRKAHNRCRKMIDHDSHMPHKRPRLGQRKRKPRDPAACGGAGSFDGVNVA